MRRGFYVHIGLSVGTDRYPITGRPLPHTGALQYSVELSDHGHGTVVSKSSKLRSNLID